jgi:hypothetical protein
MGKRFDETRPREGKDERFLESAPMLDRVLENSRRVGGCSMNSPHHKE